MAHRSFPLMVNTSFQSEQFPYAVCHITTASPYPLADSLLCDLLPPVFSSISLSYAQTPNLFLKPDLDCDMPFLPIWWLPSMLSSALSFFGTTSKAFSQILIFLPGSNSHWCFLLILCFRISKHFILQACRLHSFPACNAVHAAPCVPLVLS